MLLLEGELDIATVDVLERALDGLELERDARLVIDLSALDFMDSTGLRLLIRSHQDAAAGGWELVVVTGDSPAARVLELTRVDEQLNVLQSLE